MTSSYLKGRNSGNPTRIIDGILRWQAQQFGARPGIICQIDNLVEEVALSREQATAIFRILQEALTNVLRHAQATRVNITIAEESGEFVLEIRDNGRGITEDESSALQSLGLIRMRERAHIVSGTIELTGVEERERWSLDESPLIASLLIESRHQHRKRGYDQKT